MNCQLALKPYVYYGEFLAPTLRNDLLLVFRNRAAEGHLPLALAPFRANVDGAMHSAYTIVIAEDNDDDVYIARHALKKAGLTNPVHICSHGRDVIRYLKGEGEYADRQKFPFPRLLLLDLKMPEFTGFDVLRWIRENPDYSVIPCIILSTSPAASDVVESYRLGANAYFVKPGTLDELVTLFRRIYEFWAASELPPLPEKLS